MDLSIILATYRRGPILRETLESFTRLEAGDLEWDVWVADNADDDETRRLVESFQDRLPVHYFTEPRQGKNIALNRAVELAGGELFLFTDDDVIADRRWLLETWEGAKRWPDHSVFAGRILPQFPGDDPDYPLDHPVLKSAYVIADWDSGEGPLPPSRVWGPNMCLRSELFRSGWSYDTDFYPVGNDYVMGSETDLTHRLDQAGFPAIYLPLSLVHHQIRPEQLKRKWLFERAYRVGRAEAKRGGLPECRMWLDAPRHLYRSLFENGLQRLLHFANRDRSLLLGIERHRLRGIFREWKVESERRQKNPERGPGIR